MFRDLFQTLVKPEVKLHSHCRPQYNNSQIFFPTSNLQPFKKVFISIIAIIIIIKSLFSHIMIMAHGKKILI